MKISRFVVIAKFRFRIIKMPPTLGLQVDARYQGFVKGEEFVLDVVNFISHRSRYSKPNVMYRVLLQPDN